ncbi:S26 family signal peptidase [Sphingomonas koreensis]
MLRLCWALVRLARFVLGWLAGLPRRAAEGLGMPVDGQPPQSDRLWRALAVALPAAALAAWEIPQVNLVMSPSIDAWAVRAAPGPIRKGDLVQFTLAHPIAGPKPVRITKYALCMPGERLTKIETPSAMTRFAMDGHYFCNGELLGISQPTDADGERLDHMRWSGTIPPGKVYIGSRHPRGFDSRYFGLVPVSKLRRMERLL